MKLIKLFLNAALMLIILIMFTLPVNAGEDGECIDRIVAVVNDEIITLWELNTFSKTFLENLKLMDMDEDLQREKKYDLLHKVLNLIIEQKLAEQEARRIGIQISRQEIDDTIKEIKRENHFTEEDMVAILKKEGMNMEEYREKIENQLLKQSVLSYQIHSKIVIEEDLLQEYYDRHEDEYGEKIILRLQHILITKTDDNAFKLANKIYEELQNNVLFDDLAKAYSEGPTADKGGLLTTINKNDLDPSIAAAVSLLNKGDISPPIKSDSGIQILKLIDRETREGKLFETMRPKIYRELLNERINKRYREYLEELRSKAFIKITL